MPETAIIYGRASVDPTREGTSVEAQIQECQRWCDSHGIQVVKVVRDINRSASAAARRRREGYEEVLDLIRKRAADLLVVWETSRVARDIAVFADLADLCEETGTALVVGGQRLDLANSDNRLTALLGALMSDAEGRKIRERNLRTVRQNAEKGRPHGRVPYGYQRVYDETTGALVRQVPKEDEAQVVRRAVAAVLAGHTLRSVCRQLNAEGVPCPRKARRTTPEGEVVRQWDPSTLRQLLLKPSNAGLRQHDKQVVGPADWEALVPEEDWLRLRALLTDPARRTVVNPRGQEPTHLLSNIALCGCCGQRVRTTKTQPRMPRAYACRHEGCMRVTISADRADEVVLAVLHGYFARDDVREVLSRSPGLAVEEPQDAMDAAQRVVELRKRLEEAADAYVAGEMSVEMLKRLETRLEALIAEAEAAARTAVPDPRLRRLVVAKDLREAWDAADLADQRHILRSLFVITIQRATKRGRTFDPTRVEVRLRA